MHRASTSGENHAAAQPYRSTRGQWQRYPSWRRQSVAWKRMVHGRRVMSCGGYAYSRAWVPK